MRPAEISKCSHLISWILVIALVMFHNNMWGQFQQLYVGGGISPLHKSAQSDFQNLSRPYDVFLGYQRGNLGIRADYRWNGQYQKENFSFALRSYELSLTYSLKELLRQAKLDPYMRIGASKWRNDFTTEGYPGITDYELKIETHKGYGVIAAIGASYPVRNFAFGIEAQYSKNGNAQFIAGGFEPQNLLSDQMMLTAFARYRLPFRISSSGGIDIECPSF